MTTPTSPSLRSFLFPDQPAAAVAAVADGGEFYAGGTDVTDRMRHKGLGNKRALVHLRRLPDLGNIEESPTSFRLGARATLADVAAHAGIRQAAPVLVEATLHTATPQIRNTATLGGSLTQRPRCAYYRHADFVCSKDGGAICYARDGDHHSHAIFHTDHACIAPHASTTAAALVALDASIEFTIADGTTKTVPAADVFTVSAANARVENALPSGALITAVHLPRRASHRHQIYRRASARALADWADVEVAIVVDVNAGRVQNASVVLGAVGRVPVRATATEVTLVGNIFSGRAIAKASKVAASGSTPLPQTQWKARLTQGLVEDALTELQRRGSA